MQESDWQRLIDQLRDGDCTPFLGAGACHGTLPTGNALSREWAARLDYPFPDDHDLARVMQFAAYEVGDTVYLKQQVCARLGSGTPPDFADPAEPHALLAEFPLSVFITTNYDNFMAQALERSGKHAESASCPWFDENTFGRRRSRSRPPDLNPDDLHPLVYHLHGRLANPRSLVLIEADYLEFLVNITSARAGDDRRFLPRAVLDALTTRPLLFIGYSLQDLTFRVLFHGLLRGIPDINQRRHVSVQLPPPVSRSAGQAEERAKRFLANYLEGWRVSIFWGTAEEFCLELRQRMESMA